MLDNNVKHLRQPYRYGAVMTLGERLKIAMDSMEPKPIGAAKLANDIGVSRAAIYHWISGYTKDIRLEHLFKAARALKVEPEWLAVGKGPMRGKGLPFKAEVYEICLFRVYEYLYKHKKKLPPEKFKKVVEYLYNKYSAVQEQPKIELVEIQALIDMAA